MNPNLKIKSKKFLATVIVIDFEDTTNQALCYIHFSKKK